MVNQVPCVIGPGCFKWWLLYEVFIRREAVVQRPGVGVSKTDPLTMLQPQRAPPPGPAPGSFEACPTYLGSLSNSPG